MITARKAAIMLGPTSALTMLSLLAGVPGRWWAWTLVGVGVEVVRRVGAITLRDAA